MGRWGWASLALFVVAGCGSHRGRDADAGVRGPEGGVLTFDAAMLTPTDAAVAHDAGRLDAYRTGNDSGQSCMGFAESCSLVGAGSCSLQMGCRPTGTCSGLSTSCFDYFDSFSCAGQRGCYWSSSTSSCAGSAWSCTLASDSATCFGIHGCSWMDGCTGVATQCSLLDFAACPFQLGCSWR